MVKSLDEVIERLQYKADNIKAKLEPSYFTECIDYLKSLPREESKWIPCSERMPEHGQCVLVQIRKEFLDDEDETNIAIKKYTSTHGAYCWKMIGYKEWMMADGVIAWQPLPEPYEKPYEEEE